MKNLLRDFRATLRGYGLNKTKGDDAAGFFDAFPNFLSTSVTGASAARLNRRYQAIIAANEVLIKGKRILDIASHDGRWSFAALNAGCAHVTGIEARRHLVDNTIANFDHLGISRDRYHFILGDVFDVLKTQEFQADTVLLLGFFYHTERHLELAQLLAATKASSIILDTNIVPARDNRLRAPLIRLLKEPTESEANAIGSTEMAIVGHPSREAIELIFAQHGFSTTEFNWSPLLGHPDLWDYNDDCRSTFVLSRARTMRL